MRLCFAFFFALNLVVACGGSAKRALPPPEYEKPGLPSWQPEQKGEQDPLEDALSGGHWVPDESSGLGGAGVEPQSEPAGEAIPLGANER